MTTPTSDADKPYAQRIDQRRDALDISHEDLALKAHLALSMMNDILSGDVVPRRDPHVRICQTLNFTPEETDQLNELRAAERAARRAAKHAARRASQPSPSLSRRKSQPSAATKITLLTSGSTAGPEEPSPSPGIPEPPERLTTRPDNGQHTWKDETETLDHVPVEQTQTHHATQDPQQSALNPSTTSRATDSAPMTEHQSIANRTTDVAERHEIHGPPPPTAAPQPRRFPQWRLATRKRLLIVLGALAAAAQAVCILTVIVAGGLVVVHMSPMPVATHRMEAAATTYRAVIPGLGCDYGGADWRNGTATQMVCLDNWGVVAGTIRGQTFAQELFHLPGGTLRLQRLRVDVEIGQLARDACGGLQYQMDVTTAYHYAVAVCQDGSVVVLLLDTAGDNKIRVSLPGARVAPASVYHLTLKIADGIQTVTVNGQPIPLAMNAVAGACNFISLATSNNAGGVVHAAFANFALSSI